MYLNFIRFSLFFWGLHHLTLAVRELNYHVLEEQQANTYVGNVAKDIIGPHNGDYWFRFLTQGNQFTDLFHIGKTTGIITTAVPIDREHVCDSNLGKGEKNRGLCILNMNVAVQSESDPRFLDMLKLKIHVDDINDNAPFFDKEEVSLEILESTPVNTIFTIEDARDLDTGGNNSVKYYALLNDLDKFSLIEQDGYLEGLLLKSKLNHEEQDFYQLNIVAKDGGIPQRSGYVVVNVTVIDVNDNAPSFNKRSYNVYIHENQPIASTVLTLTAHDPDSGPNGQVGYKLYHRTPQYIKDIFKINETSGEIILNKKVDYEERPRYSFKVIGFDHGLRPRSATAQVNVNVVDINDNKPEIIINLLSLGYAANVSESASTGKFIAHVSIKDTDEEQNGNVSCSINDHHFTLQTFFYKEYKVVISKPLDFEKTSVHNVTIKCHDHGTPQLRNEKSFLVLVTDENDNPPVFEQSFIKTPMTENNNFHEYVTKVTARDNDTGMNSEIHYMLHEDGKSWFNINHQTGVITANKQFDRERNSEIEFRVLAVDSGNPALTGTATVLLNILDINDEAPTFKKKHYEFHVKEGQAPFTFIGRVDAEDLDHGENGRLRYWTSKNYEASQLFMVTDGILKTKATLSRMKGQRYDFMVVAADHGKKPMSSSTNVTVYVDDINDNYPYIIYPTDTNNSISVVFEMTATDRPIARVIAQDDDEGDNAMLSYFLKNTPETTGLFRINHTSGEIMLIKNSNVHLQNKAYTLPIVVQDHGKPSKSTKALLIVNMSLGNSTRVAFGKMGPDDGRNLTIVIVLGAVTVVLATCIVITICIIKKVDQNRRRYPAKMHEDARRKSDSSPDSERLKHKKEVSFSLDGADPTGKGSVSSLASNTTVKNPGAFFAPELPSLQQNQIAGGGCVLHSPGEDSIISNSRRLETFMSGKTSSNLPSPATSLTHYSTDASNELAAIPTTTSTITNNTISTTTTTTSTTNHTPSSTPPTTATENYITNGPKDGKYKTLLHLAKMEDTYSENSGETGASDSGRGGSEEDVQLHRNPYQNVKTDLKGTHGSMESGTNGDISGEQRRVPNLRTFRPNHCSKAVNGDIPSNPSSAETDKVGIKTPPPKRPLFKYCVSRSIDSPYGTQPAPRSTNLTGLRYTLTENCKDLSASDISSAMLPASDSDSVASDSYVVHHPENGSHIQKYILKDVIV